MLKTGGGPNEDIPISILERKAIAAASIEAQVAGVPSAKVFGVNREDPSMSPTTSVAESDYENTAPHNRNVPLSPHTQDINDLLAELESNASGTEASFTSITQNPIPSSQRRSNIENRVENSRGTKNKNRVKNSRGTKIKNREEQRTILKEEIANQKEFQEKLLKVLKERNELEEKKIGILESQTKTEVALKKMKMTRLELDIKKISVEIDMLQPKR